MGNNCTYTYGVIHMDKNKSGVTSKAIQLDKFFRCPISIEPTDVTDMEDSISNVKAQVNNKNECFVEIVQPKGSLILNESERKKRINKESSGKNLQSLHQLHSFGISGFSLNSITDSQTKSPSNILNSNLQSKRNTIIDKNSAEKFRKTNFYNARVEVVQDQIVDYDKKLLKEKSKKIILQEKNNRVKKAQPKKLIKILEKEFSGSKSFHPHCLMKNFTYLGDIVDGYRHGYGILFFNKKITNFDDAFFEDEPCFCEHKTPKNDNIYKILLYEGEFLLDAIHSKDAKIFNINGVIYYIGNIFFGRKEGFGTLFYSNATVKYKGKFSKDMPNDDEGKIFSYKNSLLLYKGGIVDGKRQGHGIEYHLYFTNRVTFKGNFYQNYRHGRGIEYNDNGDIKSIGLWEYGRKADKNVAEISDSCKIIIS